MKVESKEELAKRAELLFIYDSRMSNPNGDPDENKPRYEQESKRLLVTEFRLKRTIRKYLKEVLGYAILLRQEIDEELEKEEATEGFKGYRHSLKTTLRKRLQVVKTRKTE